MSRDRVDFDTYFMQIAHVVATRATCDRKHVGAVIVYGRQIIATGYNGSVSGEPHCDEAGHDMVNGHCVRTVHAEMNAIAQAARHGQRIQGASLYVTAYPCWPCFKVIANTGVYRVVYADAYNPNPRVQETAGRIGIELLHVPLKEHK